MVRPEGVEPPTYWFVASCSIQLSYGRTLQRSNLLKVSKFEGYCNPKAVDWSPFLLAYINAMFAWL